MPIDSLMKKLGSNLCSCTVAPTAVAVLVTTYLYIVVRLASFW